MYNIFNGIQSIYQNYKMMSICQSVKVLCRYKRRNVSFFSPKTIQEMIWVVIWCCVKYVESDWFSRQLEQFPEWRWGGGGYWGLSVEPCWCCCHWHHFCSDEDASSALEWSDDVGSDLPAGKKESKMKSKKFKFPHAEKYHKELQSWFI